MKLDELIAFCEGRSWQRDEVTLAMLRAAKDDKVAGFPAIANLWSEIVALLEQHSELFH